MNIRSILYVTLLALSASITSAQSSTSPAVRLDASTANEWGRLVLKGVDTEFPNKLPLLTYPIRIGQHNDTGFALGQILDYAGAMRKEDLERLVVDRANVFYASDKDYPVHYEPSGHDFFSSCWNEAVLMRRVLPQQEFEKWLGSFTPRLSEQLTDGTIAPVTVSDVSDPKLVHLAGLNLHLAWCLQSVATALRDDHPLREPLVVSAESHLNTGLAYINSGHYEGDHWLATFGLYAIERIGVEDVGR